jgi:hypothetical protein
MDTPANLNDDQMNPTKIHPNNESDDESLDNTNRPTLNMDGQLVNKMDNDDSFPNDRYYDFMSILEHRKDSDLDDYFQHANHHIQK